MGLITLYIAVGFFFAWRFLKLVDGLTPEELDNAAKQVPIVYDIADRLRPAVVVVVTLTWPYFALADLHELAAYAMSIPERVRLWHFRRKFRRWYDEVTDHLVFLEIEPEEFFVIIPHEELVEMFAEGRVPMYPVKTYVSTIRAACTEFAREADAA